MPVPTNVSTVTVTGTYLNSDGSPCAGTVEFIPSPCYLNNAGADVTIIGQRVTATLDEDGFVSAELIATDDTDLSPGAWSYRVRVRLSTTTFSFEMAAPAGPPINLAEQTPVWSE